MQLNAIEAGSGPELVILHGLLGSARNWGGISRELGATRHVTALDLPNHGASPWSEIMDYPYMATEVAAVIQGLGGHSAVMGHSMGGKAAMVLALTRPELVDRLVVVDIAPVSYTHTFAPYIRAMRAVPFSKITKRSEVDEALASHITDPRVRAFLMQNLEGGEGGYRWRANLAALAAAMEDILDFPAFPEGTQYDGPVLFLAGAQSDYITSEHEPIIRKFFPQARMESVANAGHWVHADRPEFVVQAVRDFLS